MTPRSMRPHWDPGTMNRSDLEGIAADALADLWHYYRGDFGKALARILYAATGQTQPTERPET